MLVCDLVVEFPVVCLHLTGRSDLGVPAWLGQHQQPQRPAHGPTDVPIRYTNTDGRVLSAKYVVLRILHHSDAFTLSKAT